MPKAVDEATPEVLATATEGVEFAELRPGEGPAGGPRVHAAESYHVEGEGLLAESAGGRPAAGAGAAAADTPPFRFTRMGPRGRRLPERTLRRLADAMTRAGGGATGIPAGYTYLGQFIDHDLTMDRTTVMFGASIAPIDLLQGRSPALDLDALYGAGPGDPASAQFYTADGLKLRVGRTDDNRPFDLPRQGSKVLIPDHRNDENLAVAQTHLAFIKFHNRMVDELSAVPEAKRFARARRAVIRHYQWMIRHDFLPRICRESIVEDVFTKGRKVFEVGAPATAVPTMPVEFSVAAFRLGHSMIRRDYEWNAVFQDGGGTLAALFAFSGTSGGLSQANRLPGTWPADWRRLYDFPAAGRPGLKAPPGRFNLAMRMDTRLVNPLDELPLGSIGATSMPADPMRLNLAFRNLVRGRMVRLATGQDMAALLKARGVNVKPLTRRQILQGSGGADLGGLTKAQRDAVAEHTPLWFYILREAELNGGELRGVGGRIVAETFHRAMEGSRTSIVRDPGFSPKLGRTPGEFTMPDLLFFAHDGDKDKLNPVK